MFAIVGVCKSWIAASFDYLNGIKPNIGLMPTGGFGERKLNVRGFLSYLDQDDGFRLATTIYFSYGKADRLCYSNVKARCPAMELREWALHVEVVTMQLCSHIVPTLGL